MALLGLFLILGGSAGLPTTYGDVIGNMDAGLRKKPGGEWQTKRTNAQGGFGFSGLLPGSYTLTLMFPSPGTGKTFLDSRSNVSAIAPRARASPNPSGWTGCKWSLTLRLPRAAQPSWCHAFPRSPVPGSPVDARLDQGSSISKEGRTRHEIDP